MCVCVCVCVRACVCWLVGFSGISTLVGYLIKILFIHTY